MRWPAAQTAQTMADTAGFLQVTRKLQFGDINTDFLYHNLKGVKTALKREGRGTKSVTIPFSHVVVFFEPHQNSNVALYDKSLF